MPRSLTHIHTLSLSLSHTHTHTHTHTLTHTHAVTPGLTELLKGDVKNEAIL